MGAVGILHIDVSGGGTPIGWNGVDQIGEPVPVHIGQCVETWPCAVPLPGRCSTFYCPVHTVKTRVATPGRFRAESGTVAQSNSSIGKQDVRQTIAVDIAHGSDRGLGYTKALSPASEDDG